LSGVELIGKNFVVPGHINVFEKVREFDSLGLNKEENEKENREHGRFLIRDLFY